MYRPRSVNGGGEPIYIYIYMLGIALREYERETAACVCGSVNSHSVLQRILVVSLLFCC